jgi:mRNA interferase MazF
VVEPRGRGSLEGLVAGSVVVALFPYTDGSAVKRRPAFVLKVFEHSLIALQVTTQYLKAETEISLSPQDMTSGSLARFCVIRPDMIMTLDQGLVAYEIGTVDAKKTKDVVDAVCELLRS